MSELSKKDRLKIPRQPMPEQDSIVRSRNFNEVNLGFTEELDRASITKVRAGRGTMRNRTYKVKRGPLVVVSSFEAPLLKSARNVKGFDVITPELLMVSDFGMSEKPGRVVLFSKAALEQFKEVLN